MAMPTPPESVAMLDASKLGLPPKGDAHESVTMIQGDKRAGIIEILKTAQPLDKPTPYKEVSNAMDEEISGKSFLVPWPYPMLTRCTRSLLPGKVVLLAGAPGSAKSWFAMQCVLFMLNAGHKVSMLALEETFSWYVRRATAYLSGNLDSMTPEWAKANPDDAREMLARFGETVDMMGEAYTCKGNLTLDQCVAWVDEKCQAGARVLFIDPITLADPGTAKPWEADRAFMAKAKQIIERHGASLVLITHPRKTQSGAKSGVAGMDDMSGGAVYSRAAASALWLYGMDGKNFVTVETATGQSESVCPMKAIRILKTRDANGTGQAILFGFHQCHFKEQGRLEE